LPKPASLNLPGGAFLVEQALNLQHQILEMKWLR
jgi:hypothetical protein